MFKYVNKNVKKIFKLISVSVVSIGIINIYKSKFNTVTIDLNKLDLKNKPNQQIINDNPFEIIENLNISDYEYNRIATSLYNPPLTSKLFPKSNLYGHELIRYFDF